MSVPCTHHCRACERHFYSLEAFDAHFEREHEDGPAINCFAPDVDEEVSSEYVGFQGECVIGNPANPEHDCVVWELESRRASVRPRKVAA